jgi:hypothetical protein
MAQIHLLEGRKAEALAELKIAVDMNRWNKGQLQRNTAFESLKADPEFQRIVAGS